MAFKPIVTSRLLLRSVRASDEEALVELSSSAEVRRYLGGPIDPEIARESAQASIANVGAQADPYRRVAALEDSDECIGFVEISRHGNDRPGHVSDQGNELELGYLFLPYAWGQGFAYEACLALLEFVAGREVDQPVIVVTQTANEASLRLATRLGFRVVSTYTEFDAEQSLATTNLWAFRTNTARADLP